MEKYSKRSRSKSKLKLLIVTGIYPPDIGGPATYVSKIKGELARYFDVHILTLGERKSEKDITYISRKIHFFKRSYLIKKFIEKRNFDIVFGQTPFSVGFGVALAKTKARKIIKVVGDNVWEISREIFGVRDSIDAFQKKKYNLRITLMKMVEKYTVNHVDRIITPSYYLKKIVQGWGVPSKKITVIHNALDIDVEELLLKSVLRKKLGMKEKSFVTVVRLAPWKGVDMLIDIFRTRKEHLYIIGDGPLYERYKRKVVGMANIHLVGRIPNKEVHKYMKASDGLILNSGYEGLPHVVIEAFHVGAPVMISNVCGNPEIVTHKKNGLLFSYNNKKDISLALDNLKPQYAKSAKKSLEKFDWKLMISKLRAVLEGRNEEKR